MKILLSGGGTAGHINPAIAIAQILAQSYPNAEIKFVGTPNGMEATLVRAAGYPMLELSIEGLRRALTLKNLQVAYKAIVATQKAKELLQREQPQIVIGTGGYVCFPILWAAQHLGIPTVLHESNASPGLTVRLLSKRADAVLLNFKACKERLPRSTRTKITGNPIRAEFAACDRGRERRALGLSEQDRLLLSFGGSLGAATLNRAVGESIPHLLRQNENLHIIHATGSENYHSFCETFNGYFKADSKRVRIFPFIENMAAYMTAADLLLCRSGAMTLTEAAYTATPPILVPFPGATDDHQAKNAKALADIGAAKLIMDHELTPEMLLMTVGKLLSDPQALTDMRNAISAVAVRDADDRIRRALAALLT